MTQANNVAIESSQINSSGVLQPAGGGTGTASGVTDFKNRIINGAMVIDQRNSGASVTNVNGQIFGVDRWKGYGTVASKYTMQQNAGSVTPPIGFTNYWGITSSSAYSISSSDYFFLAQPIEGYNIADLGWGTASAKTVTLSFQLYSSLTGTFGGCLQNSAGTRSYPFTYTISSANTWTTISVTIAGDTAGTWLTTNGTGIWAFFGLGVGSTYSGTAGVWAGANYFSATGATSVVGTNGATFYITGVQLEVGSSATNFAYRSYGTELALCQRYCTVYSGASTVGGNGIYMTGFYSGTALRGSLYFPVSMRTSPSLTSTAGSTFYVQNATANYTPTSAVTISTAGTQTAYLVINYAGAGGTANICSVLIDAGGASVLTFSAEL